MRLKTNVQAELLAQMTLAKANGHKLSWLPKQRIQISVNEQFHKSVLFVAARLGFDLWQSHLVITQFGHVHVCGCACVLVWAFALMCVCAHVCACVRISSFSVGFSYFLCQLKRISSYLSIDYPNNHTMTPLVTKMFSVITGFFFSFSSWRKKSYQKTAAITFFLSLYIWQNPIFVKSAF